MVLESWLARVLAPPNLAQASLWPHAYLPKPMTCASPLPHVRALKPHVFACGGLVWMVVGVVRVGVGAPCLGGGLSSLLASLFLVWLSHMATKLRLRPPWVLGF